jgi:acetyl esterase/lipase
MPMKRTPMRHLATALLVLMTAAACSTQPGGGSKTEATPRPGESTKGSNGSGGDITIKKGVTFAHPDGVSLELDAYIPSGGSAGPALLLIHGGGYRSGDRSEWTGEARRLASEDGIVAVTVDYRLTPEFHFPAQLEDVQSAVRFLRENAADFHVDPTRIGALGGSAGGHLALLLATTGSGDLTKGTRIAVAASWSAPTDLETLQNGTSLGLLGCSFQACPDKWKEASPFDQVDESDAPMYLAVSTNERVPSDQDTRMASKCESLGVPVQLHLVPGSGHARAYEDVVWDETLKFLEDHL